MSENDGSKDSKAGAGRPVTLPTLYEMLQHWQPLEEEDELRSQTTSAAAPTAEAQHHMWHTISRATHESDAAEQSSTSGQVESQRRSSTQQVRRSSRRRPRLLWGISPPRRRLQPRRNYSSLALVRLMRRVLRLFDLRRQSRVRSGSYKHCSALATLPLVPAPMATSLLLTKTAASPPTTAEDARRLREQAYAEHLAWMREMRRRGRRLMAMPEPEPFWLPHMLEEGTEANAAAVHRPQSFPATFSRPDSSGYYASDLEEISSSDTTVSETNSDTTIASSSASSGQDATQNDEDAPTKEGI